jgi:hypothetical protein
LEILRLRREIASDALHSCYAAESSLAPGALKRIEGSGDWKTSSRAFDVERAQELRVRLV